MQFLHVIPGLDRDSPAQLRREFQKAQESISWARDECSHDVELLVTGFRSEKFDTPNFAQSHELSRSARTEISRHLPRLPLMCDVISQPMPQSDYLIISNADISVKRDFYSRIGNLIESGMKSFSVNRQTLEGADIDLQMLEVQHKKGAPHFGSDCFVFPRSWREEFCFDRVCVGMPPVGQLFLLNLALIDSNFVRVHNADLTYAYGDDRDWEAGPRQKYRKNNEWFARRAIRELIHKFGQTAVEDSASRAKLSGSFTRKILSPEFARTERSRRSTKRFQRFNIWAQR
jgi:hypothetical protein